MTVPPPENFAHARTVGNFFPSIRFDQGNEPNTGVSTGISILRESEMESFQACITIPIINDICYLSTDTMNNDFNSSRMSIQDDPETISAGEK